MNRHKMCLVRGKNKIEEEAEERGRSVDCEIMYAKSNNVVIYIMYFPHSCGLKLGLHKILNWQEASQTRHL